MCNKKSTSGTESPRLRQSAKLQFDQWCVKEENQLQNRIERQNTELGDDPCACGGSKNYSNWCNKMTETNLLAKDGTRH